MKDSTREEGVFSTKNFKILIFRCECTPANVFIFVLYLSYICLIGLPPLPQPSPTARLPPDPWAGPSVDAQSLHCCALWQV